jgi:hypothetical protein
VRRFPFHPLLFATFPVLYLFVANAERVRFGKVVQPLLVIILCVTIVVAIAFVVFRDLRKAAVVGSGFAILALSYGHMWTATQDDTIAGFVVGRDMFLLPLYAVLGLLFVLWAWRMRSAGEVTLILNVVAIGLVAVSGFNTATAVAEQGNVAFQANVGKRATKIPTVEDTGTKRDVFYLIFDRYGSQPVLEKYLGIDNSKFVADLEDRGFYVANGGRSNYPTTAHSLASSLNMRYLDGLQKAEGRDSEDWKPLYRTIVDPEIARFLRGQGYRYAHIGPWYDPTASDPTAHINYHYDKRSEFTRVLIETTIAQPVAKRVGFLEDLDGRRVIHNQIRFQFDSIVDAAELPGPTFTFAHILIPHEPFTFAADGTYIPNENDVSWVQGFEGQVRYANKRILEVVDKLLAGPDEQDPIIVLQADEGPKRYGWKYGGELRWADATDDELDLKFGILSALHVPQGREQLYQTLTPVNTFRIIFNENFGTDLKYLEERNVVYGSGDEPYRFTDVTDRLGR